MVLAYAGVVGACFLVQAVFYFQNGIAAPFFWQNDRSKRMKKFDSVMHGLICVAIGAGLLGLVMTGLWNKRHGIVEGDLGLALLLVGPGIMLMVRPDTGLRWLGRGDTLTSQRSAYRLLGARVIGGLLVFLGLLFMTI